MAGHRHHRMALDLEGLGLFAMANDVRRGAGDAGVKHVRDYCLPKVRTLIERRENEPRYNRPAPLAHLRERRYELEKFLKDWEEK